MGVCCVNEGLTPETYDSNNPSYARFRLFQSDELWAKDTLRKLRDWNFNTIGGWSNTTLLQKHARDLFLPYTVVLHLGEHYKAPWQDIFDRQFELTCDKAAKDQILPIANDPLLIGYFSDNELGWWDDTLFLHYLAMPAESPGKQKLIDTIAKHYRSDFDKLKKDWVCKASSFDELRHKGTTMFLRPGGKGMMLVNKWTSLLSSQYYRTVHKVIRKYDKNHLILGDRYAQYWEFPIVKSAAPYVDVISTNYGAEYLDGGLTDYFLSSLHNVSKRPVIITEFYWNAMENRSGNKNSVRAFPIVDTQEHRAKSLLVNLRELVARPFVVGAHWFQFYDEPTHGRADGEDNNMGLVDINGVPYENLVSVFIKMDFSRRNAAPKEPSGCEIVPSAPKDPCGSLTFWPRQQGFIKPKNSEAFGDLYVCRDQRSLYLGINMMDYVDTKLYEGNIVPDEERARFTFKFANSRTQIVTFGSKKPAKATPNEGVSVYEYPGIKHTLIIKLDLSEIPHKTDLVKFEASLSQHSRAATMRWQTDFRLLSQ